jgi:hypothetical protein
MADIRPDQLTTCQSEREVGRKSTIKCKNEETAVLPYLCFDSYHSVPFVRMCN